MGAAPLEAPALAAWGLSTPGLVVPPAGLPQADGIAAAAVAAGLADAEGADADAELALGGSKCDAGAVSRGGAGGSFMLAVEEFVAGDAGDE